MSTEIKSRPAVKWRGKLVMFALAGIIALIAGNWKVVSPYVLGAAGILPSLFDWISWAVIGGLIIWFVSAVIRTPWEIESVQREISDLRHQIAEQTEILRDIRLSLRDDR
jgi:hypothetical protein